MLSACAREAGWRLSTRSIRIQRATAHLSGAGFPLSPGFAEGLPWGTVWVALGTGGR